MLGARLAVCVTTGAVSEVVLVPRNAELAATWAALCEAQAEELADLTLPGVGRRAVQSHPEELGSRMGTAVPDVVPVPSWPPPFLPQQ